MEPFDIALIGGDERIAYLQPYLSAYGYRIICYGTCSPPQNANVPAHFASSLEEACKAKQVITGIPFLKDGKLFSKQILPDLEAEALISHMKAGQVLFGGVIPEEITGLCARKGIVCYDFMKEESLAIFNAIATAEGAILEALSHQNTNLHGSQCLVLGYGRCGKVLAEKLKGLGARVTVCARSEAALANIFAFGMEPLELDCLKEKLKDYEYIFNTIPTLILDESYLNEIQPDALIVDLASAPGGVDRAYAKKCGIQSLFCPGLPGRYAPKTSAKGLADFINKKCK